MPLITSLKLGKISAVAQEHAAVVLSGLAPTNANAISIKEAGGIKPLVLLLSEGNWQAKIHAAGTLAQLARRALAASEIAEAGGVFALVQWLADPSLGPPDVAARALSEIALNNADTQTQISEEGAISPLVGMIRSWSVAAAAVAATKAGMGGTMAGSVTSRLTGVAAALELATVAAGALATLAKDNVINVITITEEEGIPPLLELLKDSKTSSHENATRCVWHLGQTEENQTAIPRAGGIVPLVKLLSSDSARTQQYTAAALESLARDHTENQIALAKAGAIDPLVYLLGSESQETQVHAVGALLYLASHDEDSRNAVVKRLVEVLEARNAAAQMKAAEALAVLASRSTENRKAITAASAIEPLVRLLGDGRRVRSDTPQERAAAVLSDLARLGENKVRIVQQGGASPLVAMLSADSDKAQTNAAGAIWQLAMIGANKAAIADTGAIAPLVILVSKGTAEAQKFSTGALWQLAAVGDNKAAMVAAGAIPPLVSNLNSNSAELVEYAAAVLSMLARTQGGAKRAIVEAGGLLPLIALLRGQSVMTQRHAACALWGLTDGKEGVYDKQIVQQGGVQPLIQMLLENHVETCGFAAACLLCLCADTAARKAILEVGGAEPWLALARSSATWLRGQAVDMIRLLGIPYAAPDVRPSGTTPSPRLAPSPGRGSSFSAAYPLIAQKTLPIRENADVDPDKDNPKVGELLKGDAVFVIERREPGNGMHRALVASEAHGTPLGWVTSGKEGAEFLVSESEAYTNDLNKTPYNIKMKFHFFSFQLHKNNGVAGPTA